MTILRNRVLVLGLASLLLVGGGCMKKDAGSADGAAVGPILEGPGAGAPAAAPADAGADAVVIAPAQGRSMVVPLKAISGSGLSGTATFTETSRSVTTVTIAVTGVTKNATHEVELYGGPCSEASAPVQYPLSAIANGRSVTVIEANYSSFVGGTKQSVKVRRSPDKVGVPLAACGDLK